MSTDNQLAIQQAPMFGLSTLEEAVNFAGQMAKANLLPAHLKGSPADCLRVVMQAARWQMDPFSVADKTSVINNKLMYQGQLVSAVANARGNLSKRLDYQFEGEGEKRVLTVSGTLKGETEPRTIELDVPMARRINKNGQMNQNPDQQMCYIGARMWARRHTSELMLGVYTPDEIDPDQPEQPENVTPPTARPEPAPRAKRGAAGAKAAEVVVTPEEQQAAQTPAKPVEDIQAAMQAREAKTATPAPAAPAPTPATPAPTNATPANAVPSNPAPAATSRAFLNEGERVQVTAKVDDFKAIAAMVEGQNCAAIRAILSGGYVGEVRQKEGGAKFTEDGKAVVALPPWQVGATLNFTLFGKKASNGKVIPWVESVAAVGAAAENLD